jgi:hypothetical protein
MRRDSLLISLLLVTGLFQVTAQERGRVIPNTGVNTIPGNQQNVPTNSLVQIVPPIGSAPMDYCKQVNRGRDLRLTFRNTGNVTAPEGFVSVTFGGGRTETVEHPTLRPGRSAQLTVPFPNCFNTDCPFTVQWRTQPNAEPTTVEGRCIG